VLNVVEYDCGKQQLQDHARNVDSACGEVAGELQEIRKDERCPFDSAGSRSSKASATFSPQAGRRAANPCHPRGDQSYARGGGGIRMLTLMSLIAFLFIAFCAVAVFSMAMLALKLTLKVVLLPLKLLFIPILAIALIVKLALLLTVGVVILAFVIPIVILAAIFVAPF